MHYRKSFGASYLVAHTAFFLNANREDCVRAARRLAASKMLFCSACGKQNEANTRSLPRLAVRPPGHTCRAQALGIASQSDVDTTQSAQASSMPLYQDAHEPMGMAPSGRGRGDQY